MEPAYALYGDYPALVEEPYGLFQRRSKLFSTFIVQRQPGAALRTGKALRMVSSVTWIFVIPHAILAKREVGHCGIFPVVWQVFHNRETGAAVHAGRCPVILEPVLAMNVVDAIIADAGVGRDESAEAG